METGTGDGASLDRMRRALHGVESVVKESGLPSNLVELIKIKASEINGCAHCMDMHIKDALAKGESFARLYLLPVWRDTTCYSKEERAALEWTEALTRLPEDSLRRHAHDEISAVLDAETIDKITFTVIAINSWNRLMLGSRPESRRTV